MSYYVYILRCADGPYYTGTASDLARRLTEHQDGVSPSSYTFRRRPINLVWSEELATHNEALQHEYRIKGRSRAKKEALIQSDYQLIHDIVRQDRRRRETNMGKELHPPERKRAALKSKGEAACRGA